MTIPPNRNMHSDKASPSTSEGRKSSKPIMEKRRRARINASLSELKSLLLEVIKKEGSRHSKMEKADILEMTVKHLRQLQRQQFTGSPKTDSNVLNNYRNGFDECAQEVTRYLAQMEVCDVELRSRILSHLANCVSSGIFNPSPPSTPVSSVSQSLSPPVLACSSSPQLPLPTVPLPPLPTVTAQSLIYNQLSQEQPSRALDFNTYTSIAGATAGSSQPVQMTKVLSGVQVIPTKLQSGEIAFVLPGNVLNSGGQVPSYIIPVYPSHSTDNFQAQPQTIPSATTTTSTVISPMPFVQTAHHVLPYRPSPEVLAPVIPNQFVTITSQQSFQPPSISPYRPHVTTFTPRAIQPSATVTSQQQSPQAIGNEDPNQAVVRPELPRDDSMWRPW